MLLKFGSPCRSRGERLGGLCGAWVEPVDRLLLALVVEEPQASPLVRVRVPFGRVDAADADQVVLGLSVAEFKASAPRASAGTHRPRGQSRRQAGADVAERLLTTATRIHCRDGEVGKLVALSADSRTG